MDFFERLFINVNDIALMKQGLKLILTHLEKKKPLMLIIHYSCFILLFQKVFLTFVTMAKCKRGGQFRNRLWWRGGISWFKDLDLQKLENFWVGGWRYNVHSKIWFVNTFDTWHSLQKASSFYVDYKFSCIESEGVDWLSFKIHATSGEK